MENTSLSQPGEVGLTKLRLKSILESGSLGWLALAYLALITLAEGLTYLAVAQLGLALHGLILCLLLAHAGLAEKRVTQRFLLALALAPLIRLLSLAMPLAILPIEYWYVVVGVPLFLAAYTAIRVGGLQRGMLGLNARWLPLQLLVGLSGLLLGYLDYRILRPEPLASALQLDLIWLPALILLVFTGFLEELIFRGLLQYTALRGLGVRGIYYVAALFAVMHIGYRSIPDMLFVFAVAVYFGWVVQRSGSLLGVTLAHGLTSIGLFLIFPFLVGQPKAQAPAPQEIMAPPVQVWTATPRATFTPAPRRTPTALPSPTPTASLTASPTALPSPSSPPPSATQACRPRQGWVAHQVRPGESMESLSARYSLHLHDWLQANCLKKVDPWRVGMTVYVPASAPTAIIYASPTARALPSVTPAPPEPTQAPPATATRPPATKAPTSAPPTPTSPPLATPAQLIPTTAAPTPTKPPAPSATPKHPPLPTPTATQAPPPTATQPPPPTAKQSSPPTATQPPPPPTATPSSGGS